MAFFIYYCIEQKTNRTMKTSVKTELANYLIDLINDGVLTDDNKEDWHFHAFNEDYYIIYHYEAKKWLGSHEIDTFDAIEEVREYEMDNFGSMNTSINPESIVNMLVYIYGEELIYSFDVETVEELKEELENV